MKIRYFIFLSYRGTSYHGWQIQPNSVTVQELLDKALCTVLREEIKTTGAGRTDSGVHALVFCAHFDSSQADLDKRENLTGSLNGILPGDISVSAVKKVRSDANARFSASSRTYRYIISRKKDPFSQESAWLLKGNLDIAVMNETARCLLKHSDFTSFSRLHGNAKTNTCRVFMAKWEEKDDKLVFTISADRFLRNMVRAIVGTMVDAGSGRISVLDFEEIITGKNRSLAGKSAPAKGLYLSGIDYPEEIFFQ